MMRSPRTALARGLYLVVVLSAAVVAMLPHLEADRIVSAFAVALLSGLAADRLVS